MLFKGSVLTDSVTHSPESIASTVNGGFQTQPNMPNKIVKREKQINALVLVSTKGEVILLNRKDIYTLVFVMVLYKFGVQAIFVSLI